MRIALVLIKLDVAGVDEAEGEQQEVNEFLRDLFEGAEKHAPAITFIDENDALGKARGGSTMLGIDE